MITQRCISLCLLFGLVFSQGVALHDHKVPELYGSCLVQVRSNTTKKVQVGLITESETPQGRWKPGYVSTWIPENRNFTPDVSLLYMDIQEYVHDLRVRQGGSWFALGFALILILSVVLACGVAVHVSAPAGEEPMVTKEWFDINRGEETSNEVLAADVLTPAVEVSPVAVNRTTLPFEDPTRDPRVHYLGEDAVAPSEVVFSIDPHELNPPMRPVYLGEDGLPVAPSEVVFSIDPHEINPPMRPVYLGEDGLPVAPSEVVFSIDPQEIDPLMGPVWIQQ